MDPTPTPATVTAGTLALDPDRLGPDTGYCCRTCGAVARYRPPEERWTVLGGAAYCPGCTPAPVPAGVPKICPTCCTRYDPASEADRVPGGGCPTCHHRARARSVLAPMAADLPTALVPDPVPPSPDPVPAAATLAAEAPEVARVVHQAPAMPAALRLAGSDEVMVYRPGMSKATIRLPEAEAARRLLAHDQLTGALKNILAHECGEMPCGTCARLARAALAAASPS